MFIFFYIVISSPRLYCHRQRWLQVMCSLSNGGIISKGVFKKATSRAPLNNFKIKITVCFKKYFLTNNFSDFRPCILIFYKSDGSLIKKNLLRKSMSEDDYSDPWLIFEKYAEWQCPCCDKYIQRKILKMQYFVFRTQFSGNSFRR